MTDARDAPSSRRAAASSSRAAGSSRGTAASSRRAAGILVTEAAGTVGQAVVAALAEAGETMVAGVRDPRASLAAGAKWASGTAAAAATHAARGGASVPGAAARGGAAAPGAAARGAAAPGASVPGAAARGGAAVPGTAAWGAAGPNRAAGPHRPAGKPERAPNQKPERNPAHKPVTAAAGHPTRVIAAPPAGDSAGASGVDARAIVRAFDFGDRSTWSAALAGVDRVVLIRPLGLTEVARTVIPFIDAAMESGVRQLVLLSPLEPPFDTRSPQHAVQQYLKRTHAPYTELRLNVLLQTLTTVCRDDIRRHNEIVLPAGSARMAFVDARDVGRAAAAVLTEPGHLRKSYTLSGEQALGYREVAGILTEVLGRPIRYHPPSDEDYLTLLAKQGTPPAVAAAVQSGYRAVRRGGAMLPGRRIRRLTGLPATSVRGFIEDHRDLWL